MAGLLSIDQARTLVLAAAAPLEDEEIAAGDALGRVLAEDVRAAHDVPPFDNSAMDGFAVTPGPAGRTLRIVGESRAGRPAVTGPQPDQAMRISTGAALPAAPGTGLGVVPVERVEERDGAIVVCDAVAPGAHVRRAGEDIRDGEVVLARGTVLEPAQIGVAIVAGRATVRCARRPRVAVIATGDELAAPGAPLGPGQIHDSNAAMLAALAVRAGAHVVSVAHVGDDPQATRHAFARALGEADVVLASGGVSVGPHDHVKPALEALGVAERFWRVALRPGKPTWFGTRDAALVFGLPGNPVSAMVAFVLFARPALRALQGAPPARPAAGMRATARLAAARRRHQDRDECVRVRLDDEGRAHVTGPQGSHILSSLAHADALAVIPMGEGELPAGAEVHLEAL